jgi:hypothetical protein
VEFAVPEKSEILEHIRFLYVGHTSCPQCGSTIPLSGTSDMTEHEVTCKKCSLTFKVNTEKMERSRQIKSIVEKTLEERREEEKMTQENKKEDVEVKVEDTKEVETTETPEVKVEEKTEVKTEEKAEEPKAETPKVEEKIDEKATVNKEEVVESPTEEEGKASEESTEPSKDTTTEQPAETETPSVEAPKEEEPKAEEVKTEEKVEETPKAEVETTTEEKVEVTETPVEEDKVEELETVDVDDDFFDSLSNSAKSNKEQEDDAFAVIKIVKNKAGSQRKIRVLPIKTKKQVRSALANLPLATKVLEKIEVSTRTVKARILKRAKTLGMNTVLETHKASLAEAKFVENLKAKLDRAVKKIVKLKDAKKLEVSKVTAEADESKTETVAKIKDEADKKIEFAMANAKVIVERRLELGSYADDISDKDIVNDDVYGKIKLEKENAELRAKNKSGDDIVSAHTSRDENFYKTTQDEITRKAFHPQERNVL